MKRNRGPKPGKSGPGKRAPQGGRPGKGRPQRASGAKQQGAAIPLPAAPLRHIIGGDDPEVTLPEKVDAPAATGKPNRGAGHARPAGGPRTTGKPRRADGRGRAADRSANRQVRTAGGLPQGKPAAGSASTPPLRRDRRRVVRRPKHDSQAGESGAAAKSSGPPVAPIALPTGPQRLQKVLAAAGVGSRRRCEELIVDGRVEVDREIVTLLGTRVDPATQEIRVDGTALSRPKRVYYVVNKPLGVVSTNYDPDGRSRVIDLVHAGGHRVYTVGRLDRTSEGLILVTNDGELANRLMHPRYGVAKTYLARVAGVPSDEVLEQLTKGVHLAEGLARAERVIVRSTHGQSALLEIVLREGRNREVRRILARVGHKVLELKRIAFGPLRLKDLEPGENRRLTTAELRELRYAARLAPGETSSKGGGKKVKAKEAE